MSRLVPSIFLDSFVRLVQQVLIYWFRTYVLKNQGMFYRKKHIAAACDNFKIIMLMLNSAEILDLYYLELKSFVDKTGTPQIVVL